MKKFNVNEMIKMKLVLEKKKRIENNKTRKLLKIKFKKERKNEKSG